MGIKYIDDNLRNILYNLDNVMYFREYYLNKNSKNKMKALYAVVRVNDGVYKRIQICDFVDDDTNLLECFINDYRDGYDNLVSFDNRMIVNKDNFECLIYREFSNYNIGICALFNDRSASVIMNDYDLEYTRKQYMDFINRYNEFYKFNGVLCNYYDIESNEIGKDFFMIPYVVLMESSKKKKRKRKH